MNNPTSPLVSIITVNFNNAEVTEELVASLRKISYPNIEIIVVDNGSKEDPSSIETNFPEVNLIRTGENLGFAGGNNVGIEASKGEFLLFLNNDTEVERDFIQPLIEIFEDNSIGMASPKIKYFNTNTIQYAGNGDVNIFTGRSKRVGFQEEDEGQHDTARSTGSVHGAAMIITRDALNKIGGIPEHYFLYYEEIDWSEMVKNAGYSIWYVPGSTVFHKESMSIGKLSTTKTYYLNRSRLIYMRRNTKGFSKIIWMLFYIVFTIPKNSLLFIIKSEFKHFSAFWRAIGWNLKHNPIK